MRAIVIGSGFGGAVAAMRLGQAGVDTLVLERGLRWVLKDPTRNETFAILEKPDGRAEWLTPITKTPFYAGQKIDVHTGVLEIIQGNGMGWMVGAGVGGGSLVYAGILVQPPRELFERDFPSSISYDEMNRNYYARVLALIGTSVIPDDVFASPYYLGQRVLAEQANRAGFPPVESTKHYGNGTAKIELGLDWDAIRDEISGRRVRSMITGEIWYGVNSGAKKSLDLNYLKLAEETGHVEIRPLHLVTDLAQEPGGGYRVDCNRIDQTGQVVETVALTCDHLFVAAGTIGTCGLLLKAKAKGGLPRLSDRLGQNFGDDGDSFVNQTNLGVRTDPQYGNAVVGVLNYLDPDRPCIMMRTPLPVFAEYYPKLDALCTFVFSLTPNRGTITYDSATDRTLVNFVADEGTFATTRRLASTLRKANGGDLSEITSPLSGHQVGGASMGLVCDEFGRAYGHPNLYVVDGALMPGSTAGLNPALTVAAIAERCLERILEQDLTR